MSILEIRVLGDPILREETKPVAEITDELRALARNMFDTMDLAHGIGLAAPQVGRTERMAVIGVEDQRFVVINPEIVDADGKTAKAEEGCLSIPEYYEEVERPAKVRVRFTDLDGKVHEEDAEGLFATCIQHEIDHLNGVLFVDYLSKLKRDRVLKKFSKAARRAAE